MNFKENYILINLLISNIFTNLLQNFSFSKEFLLFLSENSFKNLILKMI